MSHLGKTASGQDTPPRANPTQFVKEKSEKVKAKSVSQKKAFFIMLITTRECFAAATAKSLQLCLTLCDPIDGSPTGSPVPGILQARILEWVAISFSNA